MDEDIMVKGETKPINFETFVKQNLWYALAIGGTKHSIGEIEQTVDEQYQSVFGGLKSLDPNIFHIYTVWKHPIGTDPNFTIDVQYKFKMDSRINSQYVHIMQVPELHMVFDTSMADVGMLYVEWLASMIPNIDISAAKSPQH